MIDKKQIPFYCVPGYSADGKGYTMAVLADVEVSSDNPHPRLIIDQLHDVVPLDYYEPSPLGSSLIRLLCIDSLYGIKPDESVIYLDPSYLSWLPDYLEPLDEEYCQVMNIVNGAEENGTMHDRQLEAQLADIGRRGFKVRVKLLPEYGDCNTFHGLEVLSGNEYLVRSQTPEPDTDSFVPMPLVYTATLDGQPIDLRARLSPVVR